MQYITFDFETSGLPRGNNPDARRNLSDYDTCRAVSLSAARFSDRGVLLDTFDKIVYPEDFEISARSTEIHGISKEKALEEGTPFPEVFVGFMKFIGSHTKTMIAYNLNFDINVLRSEMLRHDLNMDLIKDLDFRCALLLARRSYLKIDLSTPRPYSLVNIYKVLFGYDFADAHNSLADSIACGKVYHRLVLPAKKVLKPIPVKTITIRAADVQDAVGVGFRTQQELIEDLWKEHDPDTFVGLTRETEAMDIIDSNEDMLNILADATCFRAESGAAVNEKVSSVQKQIEQTGLAPREQFVTKDFISRILRVNYVNRLEDMEARDAYHVYDICTIKGTLYRIRGRIDRIQTDADGTKTLVAVKHRAKGLFRTVRNYENVRYQTYLQMLKGVSHCRITEKFDEEENEIVIHRDDVMWKDSILPTLRTFCEHLHGRMSEATS